MASYFDEHNCAPLGTGETPNQLLHLARLLVDFGMTEDFRRLFLEMKAPPPTSKTFIKNLPTKMIPEDAEETQCPVCLKTFEEQEEVKLLPCKHEFHSTCIIPWIEKTSSCPLCRCELPTDDSMYEEYKKQKNREKKRDEELKVLHASMFS